MEHKPTVTDVDLARLKAERERADRAYNEALTAFDQALPAPRVLPPAAAASDTSDLERLNRLWQVVPAEPVPLAGWRARLGAFVWRIAGPLFQRQQEFNAAIVEHATRSAARAGESARLAAAFATAIGEEFHALARLHSQLIAYLQQITLYVDTKDRYETGLLWHELRLRTDGLAAGLSALGDELLKRREHALVGERRVDTRVLEIRTRVTEMERILAAARAGHVDVFPSPAPGEPRPESVRAIDELAVARAQLASEPESATYAGFEDLYRGSADEIKERLAEYLPLFANTGGTILDLGCGRGEFLEALREHGIPGRGVDINPAMVERCRATGLDVVQGDALSFLSGQQDDSLGGVFAAQVVEHLSPHDLVRLLDLARAKLQPGGLVVLETVNAACWAAFFSSYIRDITHVRPIHPDTLRYLLVARGFQNVEVRFSSPYPIDAKLHPLPLTLTAGSPALASVVQEFNRNVEILNGQLFTHLDYAAVGERC